MSTHTLLRLAALACMATSIASSAAAQLSGRNSVDFSLNVGGGTGFMVGGQASLTLGGFTIQTRDENYFQLGGRTHELALLAGRSWPQSDPRAVLSATAGIAYVSVRDCTANCEPESPNDRVTATRRRPGIALGIELSRWILWPVPIGNVGAAFMMANINQGRSLVVVGLRSGPGLRW
jgi:hypothetical protein